MYILISLQMTLRMGILDLVLQALKTKPNLMTYHQSSWLQNQRGQAWVNSYLQI